MCKYLPEMNNKHHQQSCEKKEHDTVKANKLNGFSHVYRWQWQWSIIDCEEIVIGRVFQGIV